MNNFIIFSVVVAGILATVNGEFEVILDNEEDLKSTNLKDFAHKAVNILQSECPKISNYLYGILKRDNLPNKVSLHFDSNYDGVAKTVNGRIIASAQYYTKNEGDFGSLVRECVHVMQNYEDVDVPSWLTEGIAEFYRYYKYEPGTIGGAPSEKDHYTKDSRAAAYFLNYVSKKKCATGPDFIQRLNEKAWNGDYDDNLWVEFCGKTAQQFWDEMPKKEAFEGPFQATLKNNDEDLKSFKLTDFARKSIDALKTECPKIRDYFYGTLKRDDLPNAVTLEFDPKDDGVAGTAGDEIVAGVKYYQEHQDDLGSIVHECVHVMQYYDADVPGWLVEGIADYYRFYKYETKKPSRPSSRNHYTDAYQTTAYFLNWASTNRCKVQPSLVQRLNDKAWRGQYNDHLWQEYCGGRSAQQLWDEMPKDP